MPARDGRSVPLTKSKCQVCGRKITDKYMAFHTSRKHAALVPVSTGDVEVVHKANGRTHFRELTEFKVIEQDDGSIWLAERIR